MKHTGNKRYLESFKIFPYVAWGLILCFALFVYSIVKDLQAMTKNAGSNTVFLEAALDTPVSELKDFER